MKRAILIFISSVAAATLLTSCEKTYTCTCMVYNTDGSTESYIGDLALRTYQHKTKQGANIECAKGNRPWTNAKGEPASFICTAERY